MTDPNYTHIAFVIDRSGSMHNVVEQTIAGFNQFISTQQKLAGKIRVNVAQFDDQYTRTVTDTPVSEVPLLDTTTYVPRGGTALFDAIGTTVNELGAALAAKPENERPSKVIVVVQTDGHENSSTDYKREQIFALIAQQEKTYSWDFLFIGAGRDAVAQGAALGFAPQSVLRYASTAAGTRDVYASVANSVSIAHVLKAKASFTANDQQDESAQDQIGNLNLIVGSAKI